MKSGRDVWWHDTVEKAPVQHKPASFDSEHPLFSLAGIAAQQRWDEINGVLDTWYCGAYWRNGFHEDGVNSALAVGRAFGESL